MIFGTTMIIPGLLDFADGNIVSAKAFWLSFGVTFFFGALFVATFYNRYERLTIREMYLTTSLVWLLVCTFCALPFYFSPQSLSYTDAFFETMSGLTTMGASVIRNVDIMPRGILLWRGILQWIGGLGIIVIALGILPLLRIGGMQLYTTESSDKAGKTMPKTSQIIGVTMIVYTILTALCTLSLYISGLSMFESLTYSLATIPTGGFSPRNTSAIDLSTASQWILIFFMFISGMPLFFSYFLFKRNWQHIKNDMQIKTYALFVFYTTVLISTWLFFTFPDTPISKSIRDAAFTIISILTSTGFSNTNVDAWGAFAVMFFTLLLPIGACSGSTSGGVKFFRFNILYLSSMQHLRRKILPHGVFVPKYNGKPLTEDISTGVSVFLTIFLVCSIVSFLLLSLLGLDMVTAIACTLSSLGNTGYGFGPVVGADGSFALLPDAAKWILSADMMLGRLEFMTVFVLLLPLAWRKEKKSSGADAF